MPTSRERQLLTLEGIALMADRSVDIYRRELARIAAEMALALRFYASEWDGEPSPALLEDAGSLARNILTKLGDKRWTQSEL